MGSKFTNVWQENIEGKFCLNQTFFIPLKSFRNINNKYLRYLAFLISNYELKVMKRRNVES
jgi:hypothetical protein